MLRTLHTRLGRIEAVLAAVFLTVMVLLIFFGGLARLLAMPQNWTIDVATCLFAWACFLCADIAWRRDGLMSIDLLTDRLGAGARHALIVVNLVLIAGFLVYAGFWLSWTSRARSFQGIPWISYSWVTLSLPVGAVLLLGTTALKLADAVRAPRDAGTGAA